MERQKSKSSGQWLSLGGFFVLEDIVASADYRDSGQNRVDYACFLRLGFEAFSDDFSCEFSSLISRLRSDEFLNSVAQSVEPVLERGEESLRLGEIADD